MLPLGKVQECVCMYADGGGGGGGGLYELHPTTLNNPSQTFTGFSVWGDLVTMVTGAFMGTVQIDTKAVVANFRQYTFIHIWRKDIDEEKKDGPQKRKTTANSLWLFYMVLQSFCSRFWEAGRLSDWQLPWQTLSGESL